MGVLVGIQTARMPEAVYRIAQGIPIGSLKGQGPSIEESRALYVSAYAGAMSDFIARNGLDLPL